MRHFVKLSFCICVLLSCTTRALGAIETFFGEDSNGRFDIPLTRFGGASAAEADFLSKLSGGVGTETFERIAAGATAPLKLTFPGAGTATLIGGNGEVISLSSGITDVGRYGVTKDGGEESFFKIGADGTGNFKITFSEPIAAFGFYGTDIGDYDGELRLDLLSPNDSKTSLPVPQKTSASKADGGVLFFGFIANTADDLVSSVTFTSTSPDPKLVDFFGFDNFTVGSLAHVTPPPKIAGNPEPAAVLVWAVLIGLGSGSARWRPSTGVKCSRP
jgi:hypothetical protein